MAEFKGGVEEIWPAIRARLDRRRNVIAALAYFSRSDTLAWRKGDVLIANFSMHAVTTGGTNPSVALELMLEKGVEVRSLEDLHAKVLSDGSTAFVGSMNASKNAESDLREAALFVAERDLVSEIGRWLNNTRKISKLLTDDDLKTLAESYRPPIGGAAGKRHREFKIPNEEGVRQGKTWLLTSVPDERPDSKEIKETRRRVPEKERFIGYSTYMNSVDPPSSAKPVREGDFIIFSHLEDGEIRVWPAIEIWLIKVIDGELRMFLALPRGDWRRTLPWVQFKTFAQSCGMKHLNRFRECRIPMKIAAAIQRDWPELKKRQRRKKSA